MQQMFALLAPWEFSPVVFAACVLTLTFYLRGVARLERAGARVSRWRMFSFFVGLLLIYAVLQTYFDYLSQHMFWVHRLQHLVLHHLGPFLITIAMPYEAIKAGFPRWKGRGGPIGILLSRVVASIYAVLQNAIVAPVLFVGLIFFWLIPTIHFYAMLSLPLYNAMNWSMALDGLLFWWFCLKPAPDGERPHPGYGTRAVILALIAFPQVILGCYIFLSPKSLYSVYNVCGRAWPISPLVDQQIGALIIWIPGAMMSVIAAIPVLRLWMRADGKARGGNTLALGVAAKSSRGI
jgi:putative membrane protein